MIEQKRRKTTATGKQCRSLLCKAFATRWREFLANNARIVMEHGDALPKPQTNGGNAIFQPLIGKRSRPILPLRLPHNKA